MSRTIATRRFRLDDQLFFARLSADHNPLHVDPLYARRTLAGGAIVHGVHATLWALDQAMASGLLAGAASLSVKFHKPIHLDRLVRLHRLDAGDGGLVRLGISAGPVLLLDLAVVPGPQGPQGDVPAPGGDEPAFPADPAFASLAGRVGTLPLILDSTAARAAFPYALAALGPLRFAAMLACTRLVGMEIPGLNSLFSSLGVTFEAEAPAGDTRLSYTVERARLPFVPVALKVTAPGMSGMLEAFFRPLPAVQPSLATLTALVQAGEFAGQTALVAGGSRGLGEVVAKLIAAGGGRPIITWRDGEADCERVAGEIRTAGLACETLRLDVLRPAPALAELKRRKLAVSHLYYFATPRIGDAAARLYDAKRLALFQSYYVDAFRTLVTALAAWGPLAAFYPSTVFIDELPRDTADYAAAKSAGETICRHLEKYVPGVAILVERLPKLPTDQTQSVIKAAAAADPAATLLPMLRRMPVSPA